MKRTILFAAIAGAIIGWLCGGPAEAFTPPNDHSYAYGEYNAVVPHVAQTGVLTWEAVDQYGWPQWRSVVAQSLDTGSPYVFSLGNVLSYAITVREAQGDPDTQHFAVPTAYVEAKCGGSFAVACVYLINPRPVPVYYKAAAMITYIFTGQAAVVEHETFHTLAQACDQYVGGCPPTSSQPLQCLGNPDTLMDCGLAARFPQPFDLDTFDRAYVASGSEGRPVLNLDWGAIFYGAPFAPKANTQNTQTRLAVFIETPLKPLTFAGFYGVEYGQVCPASGICGVGVPVFACSSYFVAYESNNRTTWGGKAMQLAGRTSCS